MFFPRLVYAWQSLWGAEPLALRGYPMQAYSILRNVFDSLQLLSASLQGMVDFYAAEGLSPSEPFDPVKARRLRKDTGHRLLPLIQPPKCSFPDEWKAKWPIIDERFQIVVGSLSKENGKPIGDAIIEYVGTKFPFNQDSSFPL